LLFKKTNSSVVTNVKGGPKLQVKAQKPKNTVKVVPNLGKSKPSTGVPFKANAHSNVVRSKESYRAITTDGHSGIEVSGQMFLAEMSNNQVKGFRPGGSVLFPQLNASTTRVNTIVYLHPRFIVSRVQKIAAAFTKYRFRQIKLVFEGRTVSTDAGEIYAAYTHDPNVDLSELSDRKLRLWFENSDSLMRSVANNPGKVSKSWDLRKEKPFYEINLNHSEVDVCYQGKIFIGLWGQIASNLDFGDWSLEYVLELVDSELSVTDIVNSKVFDNRSRNFDIPDILEGSDVAWTTNTIDSYFTNGVYSIKSESEPSPIGASKEVGSWSKLLEYGAEFICDVIPIPGLGTAFKFFNSLEDLFSDSPTKGQTVGVGHGAFQMVGEPLKLLGKGIIEAFSSNEPDQLMKIPGHRRHVEFFANRNPCLKIEDGQLVSVPYGRFSSAKHYYDWFQETTGLNLFHPDTDPSIVGDISLVSPPTPTLESRVPGSSEKSSKTEVSTSGNPNGPIGHRYWHN